MLLTYLSCSLTLSTKPESRPKNIFGASPVRQQKRPETSGFFFNFLSINLLDLNRLTPAHNVATWFIINILIGRGKQVCWENCLSHFLRLSSKILCRYLDFSVNQTNSFKYWNRRKRLKPQVAFICLGYFLCQINELVKYSNLASQINGTRWDTEAMISPRFFGK